MREHVLWLKAFLWIVQCLIHRFAALVIPKWQHPVSARSPREGVEEKQESKRGEERAIKHSDEEKKMNTSEGKIMCVEM